MAESNFRDGERSVHGDAAAARQPDPLDARRRRPRLARAAGVLQSDAVRLRLRLLPRGDRALLREGPPSGRRRLLAVLSPAAVLPARPAVLRRGRVARRRARLGARVGPARADGPRGGRRRGRDVLERAARPVSRARSRAHGDRRRARPDVPVPLHLLLRPRRRHRRHGGDDRVPARVHALCRRAAAADVAERDVGRRAGGAGGVGEVQRADRAGDGRAS